MKNNRALVEAEMIEDPKLLISSLALLVSIIAATLAFTINRRNSIVGVKPALVFVYEHKRGWILQNVGNGPALNVLVAMKEGGIRSKKGNWGHPIRVPPMSSSGEVALHWVGHDNIHGLGATYQDIWDRYYSTTCGNDLNHIRPGQEFHFLEKEIKASWMLEHIS